MPIQYDKSDIGKAADLGTHEVTAEMFRDYAAALGATLEGDAKDWVAPPLFCNVLTSGGAQPETKIEGGRRRFAANQSYEPLAPIRVGDRLSATARITEMYEKTGRSGAMLFVVRETTFTNQDKTDVAKIRHSMVVQE
ncbi:MAG TPA: MaoC family dehydratase N-terminal domain-containing protein [Dehalococcoidia bacterium]|nr:MaoC family dehydratase N-terminal domain-containing protein [Dehalococcoidia bacterium]